MEFKVSWCENGAGKLEILQPFWFLKVLVEVDVDRVLWGQVVLSAVTFSTIIKSNMPAVNDFVSTTAW